MELAVIGDIHSNYAALEICVEYIKNRNVDGLLFLGDYVSDCPYPDRTMQFLRELKKSYPCWFVRGNREESMLMHKYGADDGWQLGRSSTGSLLYTCNSLTEQDFEFFKSMNITELVETEGCPSLRICHGSPSAVRELLHMDMENTKVCLEQSDTKILICGHTHLQGTYYYQGRRLINPGALGCQGKAQFAILHAVEGGEWKEEYISLAYPVEELCSDFRTSGLFDAAPYWAECMMAELRSGNKLGLPCILLAKDMMEMHGVCLQNGNIPEKYWKAAAMNLGILDF